ncbi:MAG: type II toxin-antitoxin system VapC family toxin [Acidobacteria bacterium]|nr:type II toxin-antitoxin system VapC family toxin [Acidobacteriota bacterium]
MNVYFDSSALVKQYLAEEGSERAIRLTRQATVEATTIASRVEVEAAFAKGVRMGIVGPEEARAALEAFQRKWPALQRLAVTEPLVARAGRLTWRFGLRGYDSIQLSSALYWRELLGSPVTFACFDHRLSAAAKEVGLASIH